MNEMSRRGLAEAGADQRGLPVAPASRGRFRRGSGTLAALDIGSTKISCLIAEAVPAKHRTSDADDRYTLKVLGTGYQLSRGVRTGSIVSMDEAERAIRLTVDAAERMAQRTAELYRSEQRYRLMSEAIREYGILFLGLDGLVHEWTDSAQRVHGFTRSQATGRTLDALLAWRRTALAGAVPITEGRIFSPKSFIKAQSINRIAGYRSQVPTEPDKVK